MPSPKRILVATDFSDSADAALAYAVDLAKALGAKVMLLHAYELPVYDFPNGTIVSSAEFAETIVDAAKQSLTTACKAHARPGVEIGTVLEQGIAWNEINRVAAEIGADLIVLGTHGRHGLKRAVLGSVAERVVRTATQPVLTVHAGN
ncbi:MAG TPA: universal stress protein [Polyangiaceae bacterium]